MAVFRKHEDPEVELKGVGFLRRLPLIGRRFPYVYGSEIEFRAIPKKYDHDKPLIYNWLLSRWDGQKQFIVSQGSGELSVKERSKKINVGYLSITGHHILDMRWGKNISKKERQVMANFTLMDRDMYAVG